MSETVSSTPLAPELTDAERLELEKLKNEARDLCDVAKAVLSQDLETVKVFLSGNKLLPAAEISGSWDLKRALDQVYKFFPAARKFLGEDLVWLRGQVRNLRNPRPEPRFTL